MTHSVIGKMTIGWQARFDDYRELSGIWFAYEVELRFPRQDSVVTLRFDEVELNPELSPEVFVLRLRSGR